MKPPTQESHPRPETTPGVFLEHYDFSWPQDGRECVIYVPLMQAAQQAAAQAGWHFRSYSSLATPGTMEDFVARNMRSFPMLILFRDGIELGRSFYCMNPVEEIIVWGNKVLRGETIRSSGIRFF